MNWWEEMAFSVIVGVLKQVIKNPKSKQIELSIVQEINTLSGQALTVLSQQ